MNKLKEYDDNIQKLSSWIPYLGLMTPYVLQNKDDSYMSILSYGSCTNQSQQAKDLFDKIQIGVAFWIEQNFFYNKTLCFVVWNPERDSKTQELLNCPLKNLDKSNSDIDIFSEFIVNLTESLRDYLPDIQIIKEHNVLRILSGILSLNTNVPMPNMTLYLDCYLTQEHQYSKKEDYLKIDNYYLKSIRLLGYPNSSIEDIIDFLEHKSIIYRYTRRLIIVDKKTKYKTQEQYFKNWCNMHKSFQKKLKIPDELRAVYVDNIISLYNKDKNMLEQNIVEIEELLNNNLEIATIVDEYNAGDSWYATIPGMFRNGRYHSMVGLKSVYRNLVLRK